LTFRWKEDDPSVDVRMGDNAREHKYEMVPPMKPYRKEVGGIGSGSREDAENIVQYQAR
jgi:hypothetical protein